MSTNQVLVSVDVEAGTVTWNFPDGRTHSIHYDDLSPEMQKWTSLHGIKQKGSDSYSGAKDAVEKGTATDKAEFQFSQVGRVLENLRNGVVSDRGSGFSIDVLAIARSQNGDPLAIKAKWERMTEEQQKAVRAAPAFKKAKAEIQAERAAARLSRIDGDDDTIPGF